MTNAEIYFTSAQSAMAQHVEHCNMYIQTFKKYCADNMAEYKPYEKQVDLVLLNVRHQVLEMQKAQPFDGWALNDYDSVTWFLGMFAKGMAEYIDLPFITYKKIFTDCFNKHFAQYGMQ